MCGYKILSLDKMRDPRMHLESRIKLVTVLLHKITLTTSSDSNFVVTSQISYGFISRQRQEGCPSRATAADFSDKGDRTKCIAAKATHIVAPSDALEPHFSGPPSPALSLILKLRKM